MRNKERAARDVSLSQLRTFIRIVERGSLTAAALDLATTQPTVSRHLRELEEAYQVALAIRTTRSLRLTDEGRAVYEQAKQIAQAEDELRDRLHGSLGSLEGRIQVTAPSGFGAFVVAPFCCRFIERHPGIGIDLSL